MDYVKRPATDNNNRILPANTMLFDGDTTTKCKADNKKYRWTVENQCSNSHCSNDTAFLIPFDNVNLITKGEIQFNFQTCPVKTPIDPINHELRSGYYVYKLAYQYYDKKSQYWYDVGNSPTFTTAVINCYAPSSSIIYPRLAVCQTLFYSVYTSLTNPILPINQCTRYFDPQTGTVPLRSCTNSPTTDATKYPQTLQAVWLAVVQTPLISPYYIGAPVTPNLVHF